MTDHIKNEKAEGSELEKKPGKKLQSGKSLKSVVSKKEQSWEWTAKNENASFSSSKEKLRRMHLFDVAKGIS